MCKIDSIFLFFSFFFFVSKLKTEWFCGLLFVLMLTEGRISPRITTRLTTWRHNYRCYQLTPIMMAETAVHFQCRPNYCFNKHGKKRSLLDSVTTDIPHLPTNIELGKFIRQIVMDTLWLFIQSLSAQSSSHETFSYWLLVAAILAAIGRKKNLFTNTNNKQKDVFVNAI